MVARERYDVDMRKRVLLLTLLGTLGLLGSTAVAGGAPVLAGPWSSHQEGYGRVRPRTIFNGGDGSGLVQRIRWLTWGHSQAIGEGIGLYVGPHQSNAEGTRESTRVVAFQLGYCHGKRAYEAIEWYFPQHGDRFTPDRYIEACTGEYHDGGIASTARSCSSGYTDPAIRTSRRTASSRAARPGAHRSPRVSGAARARCRTPRR
jgi:hypothetical protein